jgi:hypothetical protein
MENKSMTAIEWLLEKLSNYDSKMIELFNKEIEQAKETEKQQIIDAYVIGAKNQIYGVDLSGLEYYEKTFKD